MMKHKGKKFVVAEKFVALCAALSMVLGLFSALPASATPLAQGNNLLANGNFEGGFAQVNSKAQVAAGWTPFWLSGEPATLYMQPTYEPSSNCSKTCDHRIHSGGNAQRMFQFFGAYQAGIYQTVTVPENADLRLTFFGQGWSSESENPENVSINGTDMRMRVGIDPLGGTNPQDPRVIWSAPVNALDSWYQFSVYARAQGARVTVFAMAAPHDARRKNEVYWDDAELIALSGEAQATAQASYPTPTPLPFVPTATPISVALGQNLLTDPGFEGRLYIPCSLNDLTPWRHISCEGLDLDERLPDGRRKYRMWDTVQVPLGWKAWWLTPNNDHGSPDYYSNHPANCYEDAPEGCIAWHNPEFRDTKGIALGPSRIRSGRNSQKYFTLWSTHQAGLMQTVAVPPGAVLRFGVYMHAWSSNISPREEIPETYLSSGQTSMHMKVGIDPYGGDDPWSPNIVWSTEHDAYDTWGYYEVRAVAYADKVTVYTHSMPDKAQKHNDVYVDDAELVVIDGATSYSPPAAAQPATAEPAAPNVAAAARPTALPRPDGALVHVVKAGDTVFGLSLQYDVPMDQILQLNGLTKESYLLIGQELVIAQGLPATPAAPADATVAPEPTDLPTPSGPTPTPTPLAIAAANPAAALLCVRAFEDTDANGLYQESDALIPGAFFQVSDDQGRPVVTYTSDGLSEPHCFTRLKPGSYTVSIDPAADTVATSDRRWGVTLSPGSTVNVNFGSRLSTVATGSSGTADDNASAGATLGLAFVVIIAGAGLLIYQRRRTTVSRA